MDPVILGPDGEPLRLDRGSLERRQAASSVFSLRTPWQRSSQVTFLTPRRLRAIHSVLGGSGDVEAYATLAEEVEERDAHYRAVLQQRKLSVAAREWRVEPTGDTPREAEIADFVRGILRTPEMHDCLFDLLDGIAKGFSLVEILWETRAGMVRPAGYEWVDSRFVLFGLDDGRTPYLLAADGAAAAPDARAAGRLAAEPLVPGKFIFHTPRTKSGLPARGGIFMAVMALYMLKNFSVRDWWAYMEVCGIPLRIGRYGPTASDEDIDTLNTAVANIASDAGCTIPDSMQIEFVQAGKGSREVGGSAYLPAADWCDRQISKAVVGQTMTADAGSSRSQAEVHDRVRSDLTAEDARQAAAAVERQLIRWSVQMNYGLDAPVPTVRLVERRMEDPDKIVARAQKTLAMGIPLSRSWLLKKGNLEAPADPEDEIAPPPPAAAQLRAEPQSAALNAAGDEAAAPPAGEESEWERIAAEDERTLARALGKAGDGGDFALNALVPSANPRLAQGLALERFDARVAEEKDNGR